MPRTKPLYNRWWEPERDPISIEMECLQMGGRWKNKNGTWAGNGMEFHFTHMIELIWPWITWHKWLTMFVENYLTHRSMVVFGPTSSGKSFDGALCALADWYPFPSSTTTLVCSTTTEMLDKKIWGIVKFLHGDALDRHPWLPGHLIEGRRMIVPNIRAVPQGGRDFRCGLAGIPCKGNKNNEYAGLGEFSGIHNKRVRIFGDELHILPRIFVDGISNLDKAPDFKAVGLANPKETTDAAGVLGEPSVELGGWDGGIDQTGGTKVWATRRPQGCAIQFVGSDSPNLDGKMDIPLIAQDAIDRDIAFYGKDSWQYTMMNEGRMPRGQGARRVITRQECIQHHAHDEPIWLNSQQTDIVFVDAAYGGVGGDRCILTHIKFGQESRPIDIVEASALLDQTITTISRPHIMALVASVLIPVSDKLTEPPTDQIVKFSMDYCEKHNVPPDHFGFDAGMRTALVQKFDALWSTRVQSVDFGGTASKDRKVTHDIDVLCKDYYYKFVTELWFSFRYVVIAGQFRGLTDDVMMEFAQREWGMVGANKIEVEPKKIMKARMGLSPDRADSLAGAIEIARRKGFVIRRLGENRKELPGDEQWKFDLREKARDFWRSGELQEA